MSAEAANAEPTRSGAADIVSGYLSALAIFASLIALAWHPLRLVPFAIVLALVASAMGSRNRRLSFAAVAIAADLLLPRDDDRGRHPAAPLVARPLLQRG